jgi:hypothetical protein
MLLRLYIYFLDVLDILQNLELLLVFINPILLDWQISPIFIYLESVFYNTLSMCVCVCVCE